MWAKVGRPPQGQGRGPRRGRHAWHRLGVWPFRRSLTVKIVRSNSHPLLFSLTARGETGWVYGDVNLYDVFCAITNQV